MSRLKSRTGALIAVLALLVGLLGFFLVRFVVSSRSAGKESVAARTIPNTDVNPYGANFFLAREVEPWKRERTVEMAQAAGIGWAKQEFSWAEIEPLHKGEFTNPVTGESYWDKFDEIVSLYRSHGIQVIARLDRAPAWARPEGSLAEAPPSNMEDYGDFVYAFVEHYSGQVQYIQVWNEPNIYPEWGEQPVDPAGYVEMLAAAFERAKEADPDVYVLSAPLAETLGEPHPEPGKWRSMSDLDYLEAMYQANAGRYFDILSTNAFGFDLPPDDPPDPEVLNFRRVELQRAIMERHGDGGKAVWLNEYGWNAAPDTFTEEELTWKRVSEEQQAEYLLMGIDYGRANWPWAGVFNIWYFRQTGQQYSPEEPAYYFRMVDVDFTPRRVYDGVHDATPGLAVASSGHFEETNPAVSVDAGWRKLIAAEASGQSMLENEELGASVAFTFRGHSVDLIARQDPRGGRLLVTLDGRNVDGLATDDQGRSYIDLQADAMAWRVRLPIAAGLTPGQHVLRLTVSGLKFCNVDAFEVNAGQPPAFPVAAVSGLAAGTLLAAAGLAWDLRSRPRREQYF